MFKIATWNVNSLKVRLPQVLQWLAEAQPDILALQETKTPDADFPAAEIQQAGYHAIYNGQRTYNGVAILSREVCTDKMTDIPSYADPQRRVLAATISGLRIINLYVPNGESIQSEKYRYKLTWLEYLHQWLEQEIRTHTRMVVLGDFNIAPEDRDVYDPEAWRDQVLFSGPERAALQQLFKLGLADCFRLHSQSEKIFSWWDYRMNAFKRNRGLRIDHILASKALSSQCELCFVDKSPRDWECPSDHAPVVAKLSF